MLNKEFFNRDTNIAAKIIKDSISEQGHRITTFELEYNRFIHGELLTNRMFSRNCSSSRAIPIKKMIEYTEGNMAMPLYYGSRKSGMQAGEELGSTWLPKLLWKSCFKVAKYTALAMDKLGLHKQIPNRLLEPWQMIKVVVTATDFDNFFNLRIEGAAQPEIAILAHKMYLAREASKPTTLKEGQYHLPYVEIENEGDTNNHEYFIYDEDKSNTETQGYMYKKPLNLEEAIKMSAASCAAQSYRTESMTLEKANKIFDMLIKDKTLHASPFENIATPIKSWDLDADGKTAVNCPTYRGTWVDGVTHVDKKGNLYSGNFKGWIQYRHLLNNNTCYNFNYEERMKEFD